ncbi:MAG: hypothetical protein AMXMBFR7_25670 [Planctomycetota bacterium]
MSIVFRIPRPPAMDNWTQDLQLTSPRGTRFTLILKIHGRAAQSLAEPLPGNRYTIRPILLTYTDKPLQVQAVVKATDLEHQAEQDPGGAEIELPITQDAGALEALLAMFSSR